MPVVTVSGYDLIALLQRHLHADHDGFLADIEMAETADRAHAVELAGLLLEAPDQQHVAQRGQFLLLGEFRRGAVPLVLPCSFAAAFFGCGHGNSG